MQFSKMPRTSQKTNCSASLIIATEATWIVSSLPLSEERRVFDRGGERIITGYNLHIYTEDDDAQAMLSQRDACSVRGPVTLFNSLNC